MDTYDDDIYDIGNFEEIHGGDELPATIAAEVLMPEEYYRRSKHAWMQVPIPQEIAPVGENPLAGMDDDTILTMSPTLLLHIQRTAASGGMQVISPRAVPLASCAAHTREPRRTTDMYLTGSVASRNLDWPVLSDKPEDQVPVSLFPFDPIDAAPLEFSARPRVISTGILTASAGISDPITRAFMTGRALVDLERRPDIGGSAEALSKLIAECWGIDPEAYEDLAEASLAPMGPLLRLAIKSDDAYPTLNAPVHALKCISTAANTAGRTVYGADAAIDWRRIRVLCEAVFYMSSRTEGHHLTDMSLMNPPGDPKAPPDRGGVLQMRPLPGSVWSHAPSTFRLDIRDAGSALAAVVLPERMEAAVRAFHAEARPVAIAAWGGASHSLVPTQSRQPSARNSELLIAGFSLALSTMSSHDSRGKTPVAAVRDYLYQALTGSVTMSSIRAIWMIRAAQDTAASVGMDRSLDDTTMRHIAARLSDVTHDMRIRLSVEAVRRGATLEEWWDVVSHQMPMTYRRMREGSMSWAIAAVYHMVRPPTTKWGGLTRAMAHSSHNSLAAMHMNTIRLPAELGSPERVWEATSAAARCLAMSYGAFYGAMFEIGCVMSAQATRNHQPVTAQRLRAAALMWDIRSKLASTVQLRKNDGSSEEAGVIMGRHERYHLSTAPYPAYTRWHAYIQGTRAVSLAARRTYPAHVEGTVSAAFAGQRDPLFVSEGNARIFRYSSEPARLADDMTKTLGEMRADLEAVVRTYDAERAAVLEMPAASTDAVVPPVRGTFDLEKFRPQEDTFWARLTELDQEEATDVLDTLAQLTQDEQDRITMATYATSAEISDAVFGASDAAIAGKVSELIS